MSTPISSCQTHCWRSWAISYDKNISPVGWYLGSYLLRFVELDDRDNGNLEKEFSAWENTVIVKAQNIDEAYDKVVKIAKEASEPYSAGAKGLPVQWLFEGVTELLPIYEDLTDGAEIAWTDCGDLKLKELRKRIRKCDEFKQ